MKGIDIIEAFGHIDDQLILDAKRQRRTAPRYLKWGSLAACLICAAALTFFSVSRLTQSPETAGEAFSSVPPTPASPVITAPDSAREEDTVSTQAPTQAPTQAVATYTPAPMPTPVDIPLTVEPMDDPLYWQSSYYDVTIHAPSIYEGEIFPDHIFNHEDYYITYYNTAFTFADTSVKAPDYPGLVWCITADYRDNWEDDPRLPENEFFYMYNNLMLGADDEYVYRLIYPNPAFQCDMNDRSALESYYSHMQDGLNMLRSFVVENDLTQYQDWQTEYTQRAFKMVENALDSLDGKTIPDDEQVEESISLHYAGFSAVLPADMVDSITADESGISLIEPISREKLGDGGGLIFTIDLYSQQEFREIFGVHESEEPKKALGDGCTYYLGIDAPWEGVVDDGLENKRVYTITFPTDQRYDPDSPESTAAYQSYTARAARIVENFCKINRIDMSANFSPAAHLN